MARSLLGELKARRLHLKKSVDELLALRVEVAKAECKLKESQGRRPRAVDHAQRLRLDHLRPAHH